MTYKKYSIIIPQNNEKVFNLVANVEKYKKFINFCKNTKILFHNKNVLIASINVFLFGIRYDIITKNTHFFPKIIKLEFLNDFISNYKCYWRFHSLNKCLTKIIFKIENNIFKKIFFKKFLKILFNDMATKITDSFIRRYEIYDQTVS